MSLDLNRMQLLSGLITEDAYDEATSEGKVLVEGYEFASEKEIVPESDEVDFDDLPEGPLKEAIEKQIRQAIREELKAVLGEAQVDEKTGIPSLEDVMKSDSSWLYKGQGQPTNSLPGQIALGFLGNGFKSFKK